MKAGAKEISKIAASKAWLVAKRKQQKLQNEAFLQPLV